MTSISSMTAGELTPAARAALAHLALGNMVRVKSGWHSRGRKITLGIADVLRARGLARTDFSRARHELTITGAGRMLNGVFEERKKA